MSIDLAALFAITETAVSGAVATSGTTVNVTRTPKGRGDGAVDPVTLALTAATSSAVASNAEAIIAPLGGGTGPTGTATQIQIGDMAVVLLVDLVDVEEQDTVTVLTCRDPRLTGRVMDVVTILDSSAGAARVLHCRPRRGTR